jgi:hypothetical protein
MAVNTTKMTPDADVSRWVGAWGHANSQGFGISGAYTTMVELVKWDAAKQAVDAFVEQFLENEEHERRAIADTLGDRGAGDLPDAQAEHDAKMKGPEGAVLVPGAEWNLALESCTGERFQFVIEWDGPVDE